MNNINKINRIKERLLPIMLIVIGIYIVILPYAFKIDYMISYGLAIAIAQVFVIAGIILYVTQEVRKRLSNIENELEIDKENKISNAKLVSSDIPNEFINEIRKKRYIYKASIYLPNASMDNLFLIQNLLSSTKIDSKVRLAINIENDDTSHKNVKNLVNKFENGIKLKLYKSDQNKNYSIIIIDTDVWIINNFGDNINSNLIFSISGYNKDGKAFIESFNHIWENSADYDLNNF